MEKIDFNALIPKSKNNIKRTSNLFDLGNQIAYGKIEKLFNEGFYLLNSQHIERDQENFYLLHQSNPNYANYFEFESKGKEDCEEAFKRFDEIMSMDNQNKYAYLYAGICKRLLRESSHEYFIESIEIDPKFSDGYCHLAIDVSKNPYFANWFGDAFIGILITFDMCFDVANAMFERSIELNPNNSTAYFNRGILNTERGRFQDAIYDFNKTYLLNKKKKFVLFNRGIAKQKINDLSGAIEDFTLAIERDPTDWKAYHMRGNCVGRLGDYDGAISNFSDAICINPKNNISLRTRGQLMHRKGDFIKAIEDLTAAINIDENDADAYYTRGLANNGLGRPKATLFDLRQAVKLDPNNTRFKNSLDQAERQL